MILVNVIAVNLSAYGGLSLAVLLLLASLYFTLSIETDYDEADVKTVNTDISIINHSSFYVFSFSLLQLIPD
ncbi:MAG: hypothetical protein GX930_09970 [Clostridia bacterium]|jgi:hypothetical protein|nr:hypothetical protein [Clostridia bacterium]